jgi:hypothetical protein
LGGLFSPSLVFLRLRAIFSQKARVYRAIQPQHEVPKYEANFHVQ